MAGRFNGYRGRHTGVDDPESQGRDGIDALARGGEFDSGARPNEPRQTDGASPARQEAKLYFGESENGVRLGSRHPQVAGKGEFESTSEASAVDHRGGGKRRGELGEHRLAASAEISDLRWWPRPQRFEPGDIGTCEETPGPAGPDDDAPGQRPGGKVVEHERQLLDRPRREHVVAMVRHAADEHHDAVRGPLDGQRLEIPRDGGHFGVLSSVSLA